MTMGIFVVDIAILLLHVILSDLCTHTKLDSQLEYAIEAQVIGHYGFKAACTFTTLLIA